MGRRDRAKSTEEKKLKRQSSNLKKNKSSIWNNFLEEQLINGNLLDLKVNKQKVISAIKAVYKKEPYLGLMPDNDTFLQELADQQFAIISNDFSKIETKIKADLDSKYIELQKCIKDRNPTRDALIKHINQRIDQDRKGEKHYTANDKYIDIKLASYRAREIASSIASNEVLNDNEAAKPVENSKNGLIKLVKEAIKGTTSRIIDTALLTDVVCTFKKRVNDPNAQINGHDVTINEKEKAITANAAFFKSPIAKTAFKEHKIHLELNTSTDKFGKIAKEFKDKYDSTSDIQEKVKTVTALGEIIKFCKDNEFKFVNFEELKSFTIKGFNNLIKEFRGIIESAKNRSDDDILAFLDDLKEQKLGENRAIELLEELYQSPFITTVFNSIDLNNAKSDLEESKKIILPRTSEVNTVDSVFEFIDNITSSSTSTSKGSSPENSPRVIDIQDEPVASTSASASDTTHRDKVANKRALGLDSFDLQSESKSYSDAIDDTGFGYLRNSKVGVAFASRLRQPTLCRS